MSQVSSADPKAVKVRNRREKRAEERRRADILAIWSTPEGSRYLWSLMAQAGVSQTTFTGSALTSAFKSGEQNMGLRMLADVMEVCPEAYIKAMTEAKSSQKREDDAELAMTTPEKEDHDG
jgi:hypothetical protein